MIVAQLLHATMSTIYFPFLTNILQFFCRSQGGEDLMAYHKLRDLTTKSQAWSIEVKVIRLWESINYKTGQPLCLDMILMDEEVIFIPQQIRSNYRYTLTQLSLL